MVGFPNLRFFINLVEGKSVAKPWGVTVTPLFSDTLKRNKATFPDLDEKLKKFVEVKTANPLQNKYGKHDGPFTGPLSGFYHAHLRDDAIIIYNLKNHAINLVAIVSHAEIEGKRSKKVWKQIAPFK